MTDKVPDGYATLPEVVRRLADGLADRQVFLKKNRELLAYELGVVLTGETSDEPQKIVDLSGDPHVEKSRKTLPEATLAWAKRQIAVWRLYEALQNDALVSFVRDPVSGAMFRITAADWRGAALWRTTIIAGEVRASPGELIKHYANRLVLIETPALEAWLVRVRQPTTAPARTDCRAWLINVMLASPDAKPHPKDWYRTEAKKRHDVSWRVFDDTWAQAIEETGAKVWGQPGAPSKSKQ
jgi:hypothetical protein